MIKTSSTLFEQISGGTHSPYGTDLMFAQKAAYGNLGKYLICTLPRTSYHLIFAQKV